MEKTQVAIIGAGPAGLSCAVEVLKNGGKVTLLDENDRPGGQLFKQIHKFFGSREHKAGVRGIDIGNLLLQQVEEGKARVLLGSTVYGIFNRNQVAFINRGREYCLEAEKIVIATGASENPLAFPGSTLPGVMGAGAAQTIINIQRVLPGKRFIMIGSGNVGLIVSYQLLQAGAKVLAILEAAPEIGGYAVHAAKLSRAGVPFFTGYTIKYLQGNERVEEAVAVGLDANWKYIAGTEKHFEVDTVCISVGLSPLTELCWMCGCEFAYIPALGGHVPKHDQNLETSISGIYVAGDITGIEEASSAMEEGVLVGVACSESLGLITGDEASIKKKKIWNRLEQLRSGPFGKQRHEAKVVQMGGYEGSEELQ